MTEQELIEACCQKDRRAQRLLFDRFAAKMLGVCRRYVRAENAEDLMVEGLFKVLTRIEKYAATGSFEGWVRRIVVNECLMHLRKNHTFEVSLDDLTAAETPQHDDDVIGSMTATEILSHVEQLPFGYRTVFNLYVLEGYKHQEIAEMLGISVSTSKSQLMMAKRSLAYTLSHKTVLTNKK